MVGQKQGLLLSLLFKLDMDLLHIYLHYELDTHITRI